MILIMYYKYQYSFIYNWSKLIKIDLSGSENDFYFGTEGVACILLIPMIN